MRWLVISDIHIAINDFPTVNAQAKLLNKIKQEGPFDFILITGDCMNKCQDIDRAIKYIESIKDVCKIKSDRIFICPGNHDIVRPAEGKETDRYKEIMKLRKGHTDIISHLKLEGSDSFHWRDEYSMFNRLYCTIKKEEYEPFRVFEPEGENFRIISIDSCLFSVDDNDATHLFVCTPQLANLTNKFDKEDKKLNIAMMHHGVAFLDQDDARTFENWLADYNIDVLYCGHNHRTGMSILADAICSETGNDEYRVREFTCGACHVNESKKIEATFFICEYIKDEEIIKTKAFHFASQISNWCLDTNSTRNFIDGINIYQMPWRREEYQVTLDEKFKQLYQGDPLCIPDNIYDDPNGADLRIKELIEETDFLYYFGIKGDSIYDDYHGTTRFIADHHDIEARFLLINPCSEYLRERLMSLSEYNNNMLKLDKHWSDLYKKAINLFEECEKEENWNVRFYEEPIVFRMYIFKQCLLLSFYLAGEHSKNAKLYEYRADSKMYMSFKKLFEEKWKTARCKKPELDVEHYFLKWEHEIIPTLVLNVTDKCDFKCYYCPDGGENLHCAFKDNEYVGIDEICCLMDSFVKYVKGADFRNNLVLRITGGEPFLNSKTWDKVNKILEQAYDLCFDKIVICTNGKNVLDAYNAKDQLWNKLREKILLKVSVDTLRGEVFRQIARVENNAYVICEAIKKNIIEMKRGGFKIELNTVITHYNLSELRDIYEYACDLNLVGVKVFTVNDFGGKKTVAAEDMLSSQLHMQIQDMLEKKKIYPHSQMFLNGVGGIRMELFSNHSSGKDGCILKIVDHQRGGECITPDRIYGEKCRECVFYKEKKCSTGLMSLIMRADGMISYCRLQEDDRFIIKNQNSEAIQANVNEVMRAFQNCKRERQEDTRRFL